MDRISLLLWHDSTALSVFDCLHGRGIDHDSKATDAGFPFNIPHLTLEYDFQNLPYALHIPCDFGARRPNKVVHVFSPYYKILTFGLLSLNVM